nr:MAG TPA: hypothetical protein [Caudoviricetes sp.]
MLYRIDYDKFLIHMIDYFTSDELRNLQYLIIGTLPNRGKTPNVVKCGELYPTCDVIEEYMKYNDKNLLKKLYYKELKESDTTIYATIISNILNHVDIVLICRKVENDIMDIFVSYLKEKFGADTIDLNKLFTGEELEKIRLNGTKLRDNSMDVKRKAAKERYRALESTSEGRLRLLKMMSEKDKIEKLKELDINVKKSDYKHLDSLLKEIWIGEDS